MRYKKKFKIRCLNWELNFNYSFYDGEKVIQRNVLELSN